MKLSQLAFAALGFLGAATVADDSELYVKEISVRTGYRPQVLVIFDNSGSMKDEIKTPMPYDPAIKYASSGDNHLPWSESEMRQDAIYWRSGTVPTKPPKVSSSDDGRIDQRLLHCQAAIDTLMRQGYFTGYLRRYVFQKSKSKPGSWNEFPSNGTEISENFPIDCYEDILAADISNPGNVKIAPNWSGWIAAEQGLPIDDSGSQNSPDYWGAEDGYVNNTDFGTGKIVTLYTENYLRWFNNSNAKFRTESKLAIAKRAINNVVSSTLIADFGLEIFNHNEYVIDGRDSGGRIIRGLKRDMSDAERLSLTNIIDDLSATTYTPLCEAAYEAFLYFSSASPLYGKNAGNVTPLRDVKIVTGENYASGKYIAPFRECDGDVYVIMVTDGMPTRDTHADKFISQLPSIGAKVEGNYLPALTGWMYRNDINASVSGRQKSTFYAIGFGDAFADKDQPAVKILTAAAANGGGKYFEAQDAVQLESALQSALTEILNIDGSITSPAVATNAFDRTQILDNLYYAVFKPSNKARWRGNLKKLKLDGDLVVGRDGKEALAQKGGIAETAKTFWSSGEESDGPSTEVGGVVDMFKTVAERNLLVDKAGSLVELNSANLQAIAGSATALAAAMGIPEVEISNHLNWIYGKDVDDDDGDTNVSENRDDIFTDPMHSRPVVVNYGGPSEAQQDLRIIVGTNGGFLHMFKDKGDTVEESWAFSPYALIGNHIFFRENETTPVKRYGMDATVTVYRAETNYNNIIEPDKNEKVWLFAGMRRGGSNYYALDISVPDSPKLMWVLEPGDAGFSDLGESWSKPALGTLKIDGTSKPVLFFGGGYDPNKEAPGLGTEDVFGRVIFVIDAESGALIRRFSADKEAALNTEVNIVDSIAAEISVLDADGDGFSDRLYAADTGGNIWRIDLPLAASSEWSGYALAKLGSDSSEANDRRFFSRPAVARSFDTRFTLPQDEDEERVFVSKVDTDFLVVGSGNVSHPLDRDTDDRYFILKDPNVAVRQKNDPVPQAIYVDDLFDLKTQIDAATGTADELELLKLQAAVTNGTQGCYVPLGQGEKVMAPGRILSGQTLYTTFTPVGEDEDDECKPTIGNTVLYNTQLCDITAELTSESVGYLPLTDAVTVIPPSRLKLVDDDDDPETPPIEQGEVKPVRVLLPDGTRDPCGQGGCQDFNRVLKQYSVQLERQ